MQVDSEVDDKCSEVELDLIGDRGSSASGEVDLKLFTEMKVHRFNRALKKVQLLDGWAPSLQQLLGSVVDILSPGISGDQKGRMVLGLVAWVDAKGNACTPCLRVRAGSHVASYM